jgi:hypothetical protein
MSTKTKKFILNFYFWALLACTVMRVTLLIAEHISNTTGAFEFNALKLMHGPWKFITVPLFNIGSDEVGWSVMFLIALSGVLELYSWRINKGASTYLFTSGRNGWGMMQGIWFTAAGVLCYTYVFWVVYFFGFPPMSWMSLLEPTPVIMVMLLTAMIGLVVADRALVMMKGKEGHEVEQPSVTADEVSSAAE